MSKHSAGYAPSWDETEREMEPRAAKSNIKKMIFMNIFALLVAEYFAIVSYSLISFASDFNSIAEVISVPLALVSLSFAMVPMALLITWKAALVAIGVGELLRRPSYYYPIAGAIAGYWTAHSWGFQSGSNRFDVLVLTISGGIAGYAFWYVAVRSLDFDLQASPSPRVDDNV